MPNSNSMLTQTPRISMWVRFEVTPGQRVLAYAVGRGGERTTAQVVSQRHSEAGTKQRTRNRCRRRRQRSLLVAYHGSYNQPSETKKRGILLEWPRTEYNNRELL